MDLGIVGRAAVVSGSSRGIGHAVARGLAAEGVNLVLAGRTPSDLETARDRIVAAHAHVDVQTVVADMTMEEDVARVVRHCLDTHGRVDIAISNVNGHTIGVGADGLPAGHIRDVSGDHLRQELRQLTLSAWFLARRVVPDMRSRQWGRILNIGSRVAREPAYELPHVLPNVVRPATAALHRVLAVDLVDDGITVNSVLTGSIATQRNRNYHEWLAGEQGRAVDDVIASRMSHVPARRMGTVEEIASIAVYLCSNQAATITGQGIPVDGGTNRGLA